MTAFWTYDNLARVTGGTWLAPPADGGAVLPAAQRDAGPIIWHDTRDLEPGQCYLAVKGDNFDGHDFVEQAFENGAALALVNAGSIPKSATRHPKSHILAVPDTVTALQDLARAYRDELARGACKVIGVAGSNGKTTTRHLIHHVLTHAGKNGTQSPKSFNNHLGVPLTLLAARPTDDFVACEIGTNHPGEIDFLSAIARPDIAVITSIGEEHLEFFGTVANVAREEAAVMKYVVPGGWVMVPSDTWSDFLSKHNQRSDVQVAHGPEVPYLDRVLDLIHVYGLHMMSNANLASIVAMQLGMTEDQIERALACARLPGGRCEICRYQNLTLINDTYNANPSSTSAAIDMLESTAAGRKVLVLGDMLELGNRAVDAHRRIGIHAETAGVNHLISVGPLAAETGVYIEEWYPTQLRIDAFDAWTDDLPDQVAALLQPGDTVLLKASRGMRLERLIPAIEKRFGKVESPHPVSET